MTHDQLQAKCFQWAHNTYPAIRGCLFAVQNEVPPHPGESKASHIKRIMHYKSIGLQPGALDLFLFTHAAPYAFDAKVGKDKLSEKQEKFIERLRLAGGNGFEFRTFEEFQRIFTQIMIQHYGPHIETAAV